MASNRAKRALRRSATDRRTQLAAGGLLVAGAVLAGKAAVGRGESDEQSSGPSRAYRLKAKEAPPEGINRIAVGRAEKALEELRRAGDGDDPAGSIHSARKDLKKLRSVLRLVRPAIGGEQFRTENKRYRDAGPAALIQP